MKAIPSSTYGVNHYAYELQKPTLAHSILLWIHPDNVVIGPESFELTLIDPL